MRTHWLLKARGRGGDRSSWPTSEKHMLNREDEPCERDLSEHLIERGFSAANSTRPFQTENT